MDSVEAPTSLKARLLSVSAEMAAVYPMAFLRQAAGGARGFWARGGQWVAHAGTAKVLRIPSEAGSDRFSLIEEEAAGFVSGIEVGAAEPEDLRFYGGCAFRSDHEPAGLWSAFPSGLFHLPRIELHGGGDTTRITLRSLVSSTEDADRALGELKSELEGWCVALQGVHESEPTPAVRARRLEEGWASWEQAVEEALGAIRSGEVAKVVLARTLDVETERQIDPVTVVEHLWEENRGTHVFLFEPEPGASVVGAAPETVATVHGSQFHATAVAGSIAHGETNHDQEILAERLLASDKDNVEHQIALEDMVRRLTPLVTRLEAQDHPHVLTLSRIQHLETAIRAVLPAGRGVLELLDALHPTPAVCGLPRDEALEFLARTEAFERGWYAGPVGWFDTAGNGVFAPALRMAVGGGSTWRLYAGAGLVEASDPRSEWEETGIKFTPVLRALAASGAG